MTPASRIARAYLPSRFSLDRWYYYYVGSKVAADPLYFAVAEALDGCGAPLLDIGCGIGLLPQVLRDRGQGMPYHGVDFDARKLRIARAAAARTGLAQASFEHRDATQGLPAHAGSVTLLDVLQFLPHDGARAGLLDAAMARVAPGARLVLRTGIDDGHARARVTRGIDNLSNLWGWMRTGASDYPSLDWLRGRFTTAGFDVTDGPLHGHTPFNNWLLVATRPR